MTTLGRMVVGIGFGGEGLTTFSRMILHAIKYTPPIEIPVERKKIVFIGVITGEVIIDEFVGLEEVEKLNALDMYDPYATYDLRDYFTPVREKPNYYTNVKKMKHQYKKPVEVKIRNRLR